MYVDLKLSADNGFLSENICFGTKIHCLRVKKQKNICPPSAGDSNKIPKHFARVANHHLLMTRTKIDGFLSG
jgi:hypothetical protein